MIQILRCFTFRTLCISLWNEHVVQIYFVKHSIKVFYKIKIIDIFCKRLINWIIILFEANNFKKISCDCVISDTYRYKEESSILFG